MVTKKKAATPAPGTAKKAAAKAATAPKADARSGATRRAEPEAAGAKAGASKPAAKRPTPAGAKKAAPRKRRSRQVDGITIPPTIAGSNDPYPFSAEFLKAQRTALLNERARYVRHADHLESEAASLAAEREAGDVQFDEESGEGDSIAVERERDLALSAQARDAVAEIDAALARLAAGTYGICVASGLPIPEERLEAIPQATLRVEYKSRASIWR